MDEFFNVQSYEALKQLIAQRQGTVMYHTPLPDDQYHCRIVIEDDIVDVYGVISNVVLNEQYRPRNFDIRVTSVIHRPDQVTR